MRRREFVSLLGGAASYPLAVRAQQPERISRIGCLVTGSIESHGQFVTAFLDSLKLRGYVQGRDFVLELRWANGYADRLPTLAEELSRLAPDIVVTATGAAAAAARKALPTRPIIVANLVDPVGSGLVASIAHPGGNVTGISLVSFGSLLGKQLEIAREIFRAQRTLQFW